MPSDTRSLTEALKSEANHLGFALAGATPAVTPSGIDHFASWLEAGYAGEMHYLPDRRDAYSHPDSILDGVKSLLMLGRAYRTVEPSPAPAGTGRVSRYSWGRDYHDRIHDDLRLLADTLRDWIPGARVRGVVDTAPLLEREFAQRAGLGWIGKNGLLLNRQAGSWFFLAALLTDVELDYDSPEETGHCGSCTACLDACPTDAFVAPYVLDSRRCISYLTIELRDAVPESLREGVGDWVFGCDVCQDVCPWNHRSPTCEDPDFLPRPDSDPLPLAALFDLDEASFRKRFRGSPLWRARRRGLLRNAAINLGNRPTLEGEQALAKGLIDAESLVRGASAWALGRCGTAEASKQLTAQLAVEQDPQVRAEIQRALSVTTGPQPSAPGVSAASGSAGGCWPGKSSR
tara:strand:- start:9886 stop:11094 length:1209 start_codon:yes stop_codon:yes gene_type:complete